MSDTRKSAVRVEIKDADKGQVDLVFSTFDTLDSDGDVTLAGAFEDGKKVPVSAYGHTSWEGALPVGIATLRQTPKEGQANAQFFLDTPDGAATFKTVQRLHKEGIGEWSYGYVPEEYHFDDWEGQQARFLTKVAVDEVSPVLKGAGVGTRTLQAKGAKNSGGSNGPSLSRSTYIGVLAPHETDTVDEPWRANDAVKALGMAPSIVDLRGTHAYVDPDSNPELKASYRFLHHGDAGAPANIRACLLGIAALNGATGGPSIPDSAKAGVYAHLAGHLQDADHYVPELRTSSGIIKTADQALVVLADLGALVDRIAEVGASRALKGEKLTKAQREILRWIDDDLRGLRALLATPEEDMELEFLRFIRATTQGA